MTGLVFHAEGQLFVRVNEEGHLRFGDSLLTFKFECKIVHGPSTLFDRNGAVRFISESLDVTVLRALFTIDGGDVVGDF